MRKIIIGMFLLFALCSTYAREIIGLNDSVGTYDISGMMEFLIDKSGALTISEVLDPVYQEQFYKPNNSDGCLYPDDMGAYYWAKFTVKNNADENQNWLVEVLNFGTKSLSFYRAGKEGRFIKGDQETGMDRAFSNRPFNHKNFEFNLPVKAGEEATYYLRFIPGGPSMMAVRVKSYGDFISYSLGEYYLLGLFYGIILVMMIYNLILFLNLRINTYLYYVLYVASIGLSSIGQDGTGFQFLWSNHPFWNNMISEMAIIGIIISTIMYSRSFLKISDYFPRLDAGLKWMAISVLFVMLYVLLFSISNVSFLVPLSMTVSILIMLTSIRIYKKGFKPARFFILGFSFFFIGMFIKILAYYGVIANTIFNYYSHDVGAVMEMILFSVAIADRFKTVRNDKEKALKKINEHLVENEKLKDKVNRELEQKVQERTTELKEKNEELKEANIKMKELSEEVNKMNLMLDLDNRKLQKSITEVSRSRVMMKDVDYDEFSKVYPKELDCHRFLTNLKWNEGYECRKCGNQKYSTGKTTFSRRCTKCNYDESPTAYTLFHRLRFPITKAFYMVYLVNSRDGKITSDELGNIIQLRRETCWSFKKKVTNAMKKSTKVKRNSDELDGWGHLALVKE